jgi:hypothetical protein
MLQTLRAIVYPTLLAVLLAAAAISAAQAQRATPAEGAARAAQPEARIERIRAQLLLERTGGLSRDITPPADVTLFNTIIGEGDAGEPANDMLVSVTLASPRAEANLTRPLIVTVRGRGGRVLAQRRFEGILVTGRRAVRFMQVNDVGCAGPVTIEAVYGAQRRTARLNFACGE